MRGPNLSELRSLVLPIQYPTFLEPLIRTKAEASDQYIDLTRNYALGSEDGEVNSDFEMGSFDMDEPPQLGSPTNDAQVDADELGEQAPPSTPHAAVVQTPQTMPSQVLLEQRQDCSMRGPPDASQALASLSEDESSVETYREGQTSHAFSPLFFGDYKEEYSKSWSESIPQGHPSTTVRGPESFCVSGYLLPQCSTAFYHKFGKTDILFIFRQWSVITCL